MISFLTQVIPSVNPADAASAAVTAVASITGPTLGQIIMYVGIGFSAAATILGLLLKLLLSSYKRNAQLELDVMRRDIQRVIQDYGRAEADTKCCEEQIERQRDRWEAFLKEYHILDSTRGQKVDALFRTVDTMRETIKELRPAMFAKVDDLLSKLTNELKLYVRDIIKKEEKGD
jgi:hypothetical protein